MSEVPAMTEILAADAPTNWGKWGPDDELGALNYLDAAEVLRGVQHIKSGETFTLQIQMGRTESPGDPLWPGREGIQRQNELDESSWDGEGAPAFPGGLHYADDTARIFLQGSTQYDALGHVWYDGKLWNGYDARSTVGAMEKASVLAIAEKGIVGRGVLIDMARHRGKQWLDKGETFDHHDLEAAAALPLHCALMRNLGVALTEIAWLDDLADACAADNRWTFLYVAAPLKVVSGTGAPVNPVAIR
jgi:Putative cyclase